MIEDDVAVLRPARFAVFLEFAGASTIELLFVPVVFGEELIEGTLAVAGVTAE